MSAPKKRALDRPQLLLALVSLAGVLLVFVLDLERALPGPLTAVHARESELVQGARCDLCHGQGNAGMADACLACHAPVAQDIAATRGLHGTLAQDPLDCGHCHVEHHGADSSLVGTRSFLAAGFESREGFEHAALGFGLEGAHDSLGCAACHANADVAVLPRGAARFQGLESSCGSCHRDAHQGRIARACADCHDPAQPFELVTSFAHESFATRCAHAQPSCSACHPGSGAHALASVAGNQPPASQRTCSECHASSHSPDFIAGVAVLADAPAGATCALCHDEEHTAFDGHSEAMDPALHAASGFELDEPHARATCLACHLEVRGDELVAFAWRGRSADDCDACHDDPHAGQFERPLPAEGGCLACHERHAFEPSQFGVEQHALTGFALDASHLAVACERCHPSSSGGEPRRFRGTPRACAACHADAHRGAFDGLDLAEGCGHCHAPTLFGEAREHFEHGRFTAFPLDGAHAATRCVDCHRPSSEPDENGRRFGFACAGPSPAPGSATGEPGACANCHEDVHGGLFERAELPRTVAGRGGCARCHVTESFRAVQRPGFDHAWTGYPLEGAHARVDCEACHVPAPPDAAPTGARGARRLARAPGRACSACHADPHVGQFAVDGVTECARCHTDSGPSRFDHRDARFALDGTHERLACSACHVPWPLEDGGEAVRYKPLGTQCADCHGELERESFAGERTR